MAPTRTDIYEVFEPGASSELSDLLVLTIEENSSEQNVEFYSDGYTTPLEDLVEYYHNLGYDVQNAGPENATIVIPLYATEPWHEVHYEVCSVPSV